MHVLQRPAAIRVALGRDEVDRLGHTRVRRDPRAAQVLEPTQHVVVVAGWERELGPGWVDHLAGREAAKHAALEEVLLPPLTGRRHCWRAARDPLVLQQPLEDADRGVEGPTFRAAFLFAIYSASAHVLAQKPDDDARLRRAVLRDGCARRGALEE